MTYPHVRRAIAQRRKHFFKDTSATIERLVAELQLMAFYDIGDIFDDNDRLLRVREIAPAIRRTVKKVKVRRCPHEGEGGGIDEIIEIEMADKQAREGGGSRERSSEEAYSQTALARQSMPHDVEAERAILGAILLDNDNIEKVGQLTWNDFYFQGHQLIYTAMEDLRRARNPIDAHTLTHELKTRGKLEAVGSYAYLAELASSPPWTLNVEHWAKNVHDLAEKRRIAAEMAHFHEMASNGVTLEALRGEMDRRLTPIISGNEDESLPTVFIRNKIEVTGLRELRARRESHSYTWIVNGWLARGQTSMWAGKVEHGKTTLMRELALCVARGEPFLGRETVKGRVFYAMLDADGEDLTFDEFAKMGVNDDEENIMFMFEPMLASMNRGVDQFFKALYERHPALVIIDPVARLRQVKDFNDIATLT